MLDKLFCTAIISHFNFVFNRIFALFVSLLQSKQCHVFRLQKTLFMRFPRYINRLIDYFYFLFLGGIEHFKSLMTEKDFLKTS